MPIADLLNKSIRHFIKHKNKYIILGLALVALNFLILGQMLGLGISQTDLKINFLDVDQGDSEFVILPGGAKVLIDGGPPNGKVLENLTEILSPLDRYIDLVILSHPQLDHFGGLIEVLRRYQVGAFLYNGRGGTTQAFLDLKKTLEENSIKLITIARGDKIHYKDSHFNILWPDSKILGSSELNDTSIVAELVSNNSKTLFTGDTGSNIEEQLLKFYSSDINVLKVPHHGSRFSSSANFLEAVKPEIAVIEVGKNSYGHPTSEALGRLQDIGAKIFRTDQGGNLELVINGQGIKVFQEN